MPSYLPRLLWLSLSVALVGCNRTPDAHEGTAAVACPFTPGNLRIDSATVAGLPTQMALGALRRQCPAARVDTVGVGGTSSVALSFSAPGGVVSAVQTEYDAYGDSLHLLEPADLWIARGDSVRFPDGHLMPTTVGRLRALDSTAVVIVDHGDDGSGSYIVVCRYPHLAFILSNVWPTFTDTGAVPIARVDRRDTTRVWRIERDTSIDPRISATCARALATQRALQRTGGLPNVRLRRTIF